MTVRVGMGFDAHQLVQGRPLVLGGVEVPFEKGLAGHSDGDVLVHAIIDALLGAAGLGAKGSHFPSTDPQYSNISSLLLLAQAVQLLHVQGWRVVNVDATMMAQRPHVGPFIESMKTKVSEVLGIPQGDVSIKATTTDHLGFVGREEGIAAHAVTLLEEQR